MKETSILAHESIKPDKARLHNKIMYGLETIGFGSFRDIAKASNLTDAQTWKRLSELKELGWIEELSTKKCDVSGRKVTVWGIVDNSDFFNKLLTVNN